MIKKHPFNQVPAYRSFVNARDRALEKVFQTTQMRITSVLQDAFAQAMAKCVASYPHAQDRRNAGALPIVVVAQCDWHLQSLFLQTAHQIDTLVGRLRRYSYALSHAGEAEAIGRATGKSTRFEVSQSHLTALAKSPMKSGASLKLRCQVALNRVRRDLIDAFETSISLDENSDEMKLRLYRALPRRKFFTNTPVILKRSVRESDPLNTKKVSMAVGFVTDEDWNGLVDEYKSDFVPPLRGPEDIVGVAKPSGRQPNMYAWELERDVTQAFVEDVRTGQVDAARVNGIMDFVWVAVIDDRTEEFDRWADGKLTSEIKEAIDSGTAPDSEFQSEVPPAHFNCRCTLAPATEEMPEPPPSNLEDFESWLNS